MAPPLGSYLHTDEVPSSSKSLHYKPRIVSELSYISQQISSVKVILIFYFLEQNRHLLSFSLVWLSFFNIKRIGGDGKWLDPNNDSAKKTSTNKNVQQQNYAYCNTFPPPKQSSFSTKTSSPFLYTLELQSPKLKMAIKEPKYKKR